MTVAIGVELATLTAIVFVNIPPDELDAVRVYVVLCDGTTTAEDAAVADTPLSVTLWAFGALHESVTACPWLTAVLSAEN
ncbi:hypothetical protein GCM10011400_60830 [Paraburkholderia caffeinilytica]|uniref:Secreted protein n=1 Tax=Paraburkholderia caffeinilytica TaxID=1761016 RepID=A0ABQ1NAB1_9BURK|nr:hypothetical protein GCM10011400_60830 [Paraburkholderia caffeinilytica]